MILDFFVEKMKDGIFMKEPSDYSVKGNVMVN